MSLIDLHTHSNYSDGTDTPELLVQRAKDAGITVLALTDHDTVAGLARAREACVQRGIEFVPGVEFSTSWRGITVHTLGYFIDETSDELCNFLQEQRQMRVNRMHRMVENLAKDFAITWKDVYELAQSQRAHISDAVEVPVGRPHIADTLIRAGIVATRQEAFDRFLHTGSPYYVHMEAPDPTGVIQLVRRIGGVPVFAHPRAAKRQRRFLGIDAIRSLRDAGLFALEVKHPEQTEEAQELLSGWCRELGLAQTGGSDYHGTGKVNRLGEGYTTPEVYAKLKSEARYDGAFMSL